MLAGCTAPSVCRCLTKLVVLVLACVLPASSSLAWPAVHLRSATIPARFEEQGLSSVHRRRLLQHDCHTEHAAWGVLHSAHQVFATQAPALSHRERQEVVEHVEEAGARIMGYLPDDTLLLVGHPTALERAANHSHFVWTGPHEAAYKVAPEWEALLAQVDFIAAGLGLSSHSGGSGRSSRGMGGAVNSTQVKQLQLAAALTQLPVRVAHRVGEWPRIGINVVYPAAFIPQPHASDHPHAVRHAARILRVRREQAEMHAGSAAAADWAPLLRDAFGGSVEVHSGGPHQAAVFAPADQLQAVVSWLAERPAVHWVAPMPRHQMRNRQASCISQSAKPAPGSGSIDVDPSLHPLWAAGLTGKNQVIGIGDSGLDRNHCFFRDPTVDWTSAVSVVNGVRQFSSTAHRKIRMYRAFADFVDANGHGTHTSGTLAGIPYGTDLASDSSINVGMAPDAKLAFIDLSSAADGDSIITPYDLMHDYFVYTSQVGAAIHSDSWGSSSITYDTESAQVDAYCWQNPSFLPVFPAGNDGGKLTTTGLGSDTVNSPATSKNCLAVGATQTSQETLTPGAAKNYNAWIAKAITGPSLASTFPVLEAAFGASVGSLGSASFALVAASPGQACLALQNPAPGLSGALVLIERGNCTFQAKALVAQAAGAAAVLIYDNQVGAYFVPQQDNSTQATVTIPTMFIPRRIGQNLLAVLNLGRPVSVTFSAARAPANGFENLAPFSSQGPVGRDNRVKPDIVAPGMLTSAAADTTGQLASSGGTCGYATYGGTSMATPVVAASAALVKQYYEDGFYPSGAANPPDALKPSAALLKATLVSGAAALQGYEAATGLPIDPPPSNRQGYGRVFLGQSLYLQGNPSSPKRLQVLDAIPINTGDSHQYCVSAGGGPLTVTLVWTDYPGSPAAAKSLVNDLDLTVRAEALNGIPLLGNGGSIDDSNQPDAVNNIEQVALPAVPAGSVSIEVRGRSVQAASGPQPYALVVSGDFSGALQNPTTSSAGQCTVVVAVITAGPGAITNQAAPQFTFSTQTGSTQGVSFECRMADGSGAVGAAGTSDWQACTSPATFSSLPDGKFTFDVRAQGETAATSQSFLKDTTPPQTSLAPAPSQLEPSAALPSASPASTAQPSASFSFTAADATAVTFACQLAVSGGAAQQAPPQAGWLVAPEVELGSWYNCSSPQTVAWLLPGQWTFSVRGTDAAGNAAQPSAFSWGVAFDPAKQYARVLSGPLLKVGKANVSFSLAALSAAGGSVAAVAGVGTECAVVAGDTSAMPSQWTPCSSPAQFNATADGSYKFAARIAGDPSAASTPDPDTWAVSVFEVDTTPPIANITAGPPNGTAISTNGATFQFSINEAGSTATCVLTSTPSPCSSPAQFSNLSDGWYRFAVTPTDVVGNVGAPATADFVVDTTPPNITDLQAPVALTSGALNITFTATDGAVGSGIKNVTCRARPLAVTPANANSTNFSDPRWGWAPCASPWAVSGLVEGHWSVGVQAFDNSNNPSGPTELELWVDSTPPTVNVTGAPPKDAVLAGGTVVFNISDGSTPPSAPSSVGSPVQWQSLLQSITADQYKAYRNGTAAGANAGGSGGTAAAQSIRADSSAAPGSPMSRAEVSQLQNSATLGRGDVGSWANCGAVCTYSGLGGGAYTFQARGTDAAGNSGPTSPPYAFQVSGASSSGLPTWALATIIAVGGVAVIIAVVSIVCCCRRRKRADALARPPAGAIAAAHGGAYAAYPMAPTNGWGPPQPQYQQYPSQYPYAPNGSGLAHPPYSQHGVVNGAAPCPPRLPASELPQDPVEAQELALALAASEHEARREREAAAAVGPYAAAAGLRGEQDAELRAAIEASLREQQRRTAVTSTVGVSEEEDDALRAALENSLRDQGTAHQQHGPSAPTMSTDWPPRQ